jgi:pilus assembly protein CpaF
MIKTFLRKIEEMGEKAQKKELENIERYTIPKLKIFVTETIDEILKQGIDDKGIDIDEYNSRQIRKNTLRAALRDCAAGNKGHKEFVKMYIIDLITQVYGVNENNIDSIIKFKHLEKLTIQDKFDIVLYM